MSDIVIRVENLSKRYRIGMKEEIHDTFAGAITSFVRSPLKNLKGLRRLSHFEEDGNDPEDVIWALKDVSFEVKRGEVLGIIGRNGAGKSTLLKILSKITYPTTGRVELNGRVASLLEVGTGFHSELTGRENIYLNGTILGMTKKEIDRKFDEIVDFSGVEQFIDTPVKRYSSGMYVRLAFAVAAHLEPEILLIDEVLAVGDAEFQKKCLGKIGEVAEGGRTVLFVSHNMAQVNRLCARAIMFQQGIIKGDGPASEIITDYSLNLIDTNSNQLSAEPLKAKNGLAILESFRIFGAEYQEPLQTGKPCHIELDYIFLETIINPGVIVSIRSLENIELFRLSTNPISGFSTGKCLGCIRYTLRLDELLLTGGSYILAVGLSLPKIAYLIPITEVGRFDILSTDYYSSGFSLANHFGFLATSHSWKMQTLEKSIE